MHAVFVCEGGGGGGGGGRERVLVTTVLGPVRPR